MSERTVLLFQAVWVPRLVRWMHYTHLENLSTLEQSL